MFNNREGFSYTLMEGELHKTIRSHRSDLFLLKKNNCLPSATFQGDEGDQAD